MIFNEQEVQINLLWVDKKRIGCAGSPFLQVQLLVITHTGICNCERQLGIIMQTLDYAPAARGVYRTCLLQYQYLGPADFASPEFEERRICLFQFEGLDFGFDGDFCCQLEEFAYIQPGHVCHTFYLFFVP